MKLINIKDYLLLIDEEAICKPGELYLLSIKQNIKPKSKGVIQAGDKIIAYYPLTKEAKELDLPLLPNHFEIKFERLANKEIKDLHHSMDYTKAGLIATSFEEGYKSAQSKQFSLDDMLWAFKMGRKKEVIGQLNCKTTVEEFKEHIQSLSTQQLPKEFIPEIRKIDKYSYKDNYGKQCFTFKGLLKGDILISNKNKEGIGGDFTPFPMTLIKESKEYIVKEVSSFGFYMVPWIIDEDGNHTIPDFDSFSVKSKENFKTIINSEGKQELVGTYI